MRAGTPHPIRLARELLADLLADGVDYVPRPEPAPPRDDAGTKPAPRSPRTRSEPAPEPVRPVARPAASDLFAPTGDETLEAIRTDLGDCTRCRLSEERSSIVFGEGSPEAPVIFVGEGPGAEEDRTGRPFVGRAGELLNRIIASVGWRRDEVYICNVVKCRPPGNREPRPDEVACCRGFLERQLRSIRPRVIVALGKPATSTLLGRAVAITRVRGIWHDWEGIPMMPTYHPAYLLRSYTRETRQAVWDDLRAVRARVEGESHG